VSFPFLKAPSFVLFIVEFDLSSSRMPFILRLVVGFLVVLGVGVSRGFSPYIFFIYYGS
jgi:hypothetical protein